MLVAVDKPYDPAHFDNIDIGLAIGNEAAAHSKELLKANGVTHIVNMTETPTPDPRWAHKGNLFHRPIEDRRTADIYAHFPDVVKFIDDALMASSSAKIFIHCHQGTSRSATILMAYLMHSRHCSLRDAFNFVLSARKEESPPTHPNPGFLNDLCRWEKILGAMPRDGPSLTFEEYSSSRSGKLVWDGRNRGIGDVAEACSHEELSASSPDGQ